MKGKILTAAITENEDGAMLLCKKPDGSPPYTETWYIFGAEFLSGQGVSEALARYIKNQTRLYTEISDYLSWGNEIKHDIDNDEYRRLLIEKIYEEADELSKNGADAKNILSKLADLQTVLAALCNGCGFSKDQVGHEMQHKESKVGSFSKRYFMEYQDLAEESEWLKSFVRKLINSNKNKLTSLRRGHER